jgi:hypothetical protein
LTPAKPPPQIERPGERSDDGVLEHHRHQAETLDHQISGGMDGHAKL